MFCGGQQVRTRPCLQEETAHLTKIKELLMRKKEFLKGNIDQELQFAKTIIRNDRGGALQALRRKKWHEKHLLYIDSAIQTMRSACEYMHILSHLNDMFKDMSEEKDATPETPDTVVTSVSFGLELDEVFDSNSSQIELEAELERLEENMDDTVFNRDTTEEKVIHPKLSSTASASQNVKTEEDDFEDAVDSLRRWVHEAVKHTEKE